MLKFDYTSIFTFAIILSMAFVILLNLDLDESINDKWSKLFISFLIAICLATGVYIYNVVVSDELMTTNFAFDEIKLPEPEHLIT